LVVSNNNIGDAGAQILATAIASITELHLKNCNISSEGFSAISRAICGRSQPVSCLNMMLVSRYSAWNNSHYELAFDNSCLLACLLYVRAGMCQPVICAKVVSPVCVCAHIWCWPRFTSPKPLHQWPLQKPHKRHKISNRLL